jgi:hypothetical protein
MRKGMEGPGQSMLYKSSISIYLGRTRDCVGNLSGYGIYRVIKISGST